MSVLITIAALAVVLGVLIFIHEAGHFLAAKAAGIHVHRFALGLGTPIKGLSFTRSGTEYAICWLPLGGYVKMATREEEATSSALEGPSPASAVPPEKFFESKPVWSRMVVILAGVVMNALFAWLVFSFLAVKNGRQIDPETRVGRVVAPAQLSDALRAVLAELAPGDRIVAVSGQVVDSWDGIVEAIANAPGDTVVIARAEQPPVVLAIHHDALEDRVYAAQAIVPWRDAVVGQLVPGQPAEKAGFAVGDTMVAVDGEPIAQWWDLVARIEAAAGRELQVEVIGADGRRIVRVTPQAVTETAPDGSSRTVGKIGLGSLLNLRSEELTLGQAIVAGWGATASASTQIVRTVRGMVSGRVSTQSVGGPILIGQLAGQAAQLGLDPFLAFMAIISINLAVLNLLPIPVLDGGQFLFLLAEGVIRRPLSLRLRERLTAVGLVLILMLMVMAFWNDLRRVFGV